MKSQNDRSGERADQWRLPKLESKCWGNIAQTTAIDELDMWGVALPFVETLCITWWSPKFQDEVVKHYVAL